MGSLTKGRRNDETNDPSPLFPCLNSQTQVSKGKIRLESRGEGCQRRKEREKRVAGEHASF